MTNVIFAVAALIIGVLYFVVSGSEIRDWSDIFLIVALSGFLIVTVFARHKAIVFVRWESSMVTVQRETDKKSGQPGEMISLNPSEPIKLFKWTNKGVTTLYVTLKGSVGDKKRLQFSSHVFGHAGIDQLESWLRSHYTVA